MLYGHRLVMGALAAMGLAVGCARPSNPWVYAEPPAVSVVNVAAQPVRSGKTVIAIAQFTNPDAPQLEWPDVGMEMTRALRRTLFNEGDFEVRIATEIEQRASNPDFIKAKNKDKPVGPVPVDFVLTGQITDFHHTAGLPKDASRWGLIGRRNEAVVAIEWVVIDVRARRVVATDHSHGAAKASRKKSVSKQYEGLDASAYLFWNTPLGRAAHEAIDNTIQRLREVLPGHIGDPRIVEVLASRKVEINGGWQWGMTEGQEYYVVRRDDEKTPPRGIYDADTGRPLQVRIGTVKQDSSTAWLMGKPPAGAALNGAFLTRQAPPVASGDLTRRAALADG